MLVFRTFKSKGAAVDYRKQYGTGGWIFVPNDETSEVILFPLQLTPTKIFKHPFTAGLAGKLA